MLFPQRETMETWRELSIYGAGSVSGSELPFYLLLKEHAPVVTTSTAKPGFPRGDMSVFTQLVESFR